MAHLRPATVNSWSPSSSRRSRGVDHLGIVGTVAPGIFAQEGRCWRFVYENSSSQAGHCMAPVSWRGRYRYVTGWKPAGRVRGTPVTLVGARRMG
jgi:hypothetical protein